MTYIAPQDMVMTYTNVPDDTTTPVWDAATGWVLGDEVQKNTKIYKAASPNTGVDPETDDGTTWVYKERTNKWKWNDEKIETKTSNPDHIYMELDKDNATNIISFFGLEGTDITVSVIDGGLKVFEETQSLMTRSPDGWSDFFFKNDFEIHKIAVFYVPYTYRDAYFTVKINGSVAKVGLIEAGIKKKLGCTLVDPTVRIMDFSQVTTDAFGNTSFTQGNSVKLIEAGVTFDTLGFDAVFSVLDDNRSSPFVYLADDREEGFARTLIVYGYYEDMTMTYKYGKSNTSIKLRGLI